MYYEISFAHNLSSNYAINVKLSTLVDTELHSI